MGDFERTFGAGADAASIIDGYSREQKVEYSISLMGIRSRADRKKILFNEYNWCLKEYSCTENHNELVAPGVLDVTVQVQMALSAILRAPKPAVGCTTLLNTLIGKLDYDVIKTGMNKIKTFGVGRDVPRHAWELIFIKMIREKLLDGTPFLRSKTSFVNYRIGDEENWRGFLRGTNRLVINVETIRALERAEAAHVLRETLTEPDPNGKSKDARRDRRFISPLAADQADYWLAVLSGKKSFVAKYLTLSAENS